MNSPQKSYSALIAEDNILELKLLQLAIEEAKLLPLINLTIARDGEEAMNALLEEEIKFDLVLLDLNMPKFSGKEVLAQVRKNPLLNTTTIIVLSNSDTRKDIDDCYCLGADGYVQKPTQFDHLITFCEAIRDSLEQQGKICMDFIRNSYEYVETASLQNQDCFEHTGAKK